MFKYLDTKGFYEILINRHIKNSEIKFHDFFESILNSLIILLSMAENEITLTPPSNRNKKPISPAEKLAITLR